MGRGRGFAAGFLMGVQGANAGLNAYYTSKDREESEKLKKDLGDAANQNQVTEQVSGDDALQHFQDNYVPQEGGPATAQEYLLQHPDIMSSMSGQKAGFAVGKNTYADRTAAQTAANGLNTQAMAEAYAKNGRPEDALRLNQMARQGTLQELQIKGAERSERDAQRDEEYKNGFKDLYAKSRHAQINNQYQSELADYQQKKSEYDAKVQGGADPKTLGAAPVQPVKPSYGIADSLHDTALGLEYDSKYGKFDPSKWQSLAEKMEKVNAEGYEKSMRILHNGNLKEALKEFNKGGDVKLDEKDVVSYKPVETVIDGAKVKTYELTYRTPNGQTASFVAANELNGLGKAQDIFNRHFQVKEDERGDKRLGLEGARVGIAQQEAARSAEKWKIEKPELEARADDTKAQRQARKDLSDAIDTGDPSKIEAARQKAIASGIKLEKPNNEYNWVPSQGIQGGGTLVNKESGSAAMYDGGGKQVAVITPPGKSPAPKPAPTDADIRFTAQKYNISEDEVRKRLGISASK